jgi:hypothetical protein
VCNFRYRMSSQPLSMCLARRDCVDRGDRVAPVREHPGGAVDRETIRVLLRAPTRDRAAWNARVLIHAQVRALMRVRVPVRLHVRVREPGQMARMRVRPGPAVRRRALRMPEVSWLRVCRSVSSRVRCVCSCRCHPFAGTSCLLRCTAGEPMLISSPSAVLSERFQNAEIACNGLARHRTPPP